MYRILIDGRFIGVGESISRYTLELTKGVLELDKQNHYTLLIRPQGKEAVKQFFGGKFVKSGANDQTRLVKKSDSDKSIDNLTIKILDIPHYSLAEQTKLCSYLRKEKFDLVHFTQFNHPIFYNGKYVITIHDLTLLGHLYRMNPVKRIGFRLVMRSAVLDSSKIITISNYSKNDIVNTFLADKDKIEAVYLGVDEKFHCKYSKQQINKFMKKYEILGNYILYAGMWKKHKNIIRMLKAYEIFIKDWYSDDGPNKDDLGDSPIQLVLAGKIDRNEPEIINEIKRVNESIRKVINKNIDAVLTIGYIEELELPIAYAGALFYCIPSLSEGFGLPPLEAMACGTPVISAKISAMPEVLANAVKYFDPYSLKKIAQAFIEVASDEILRDDLKKRGVKQASKYNWAETSKNTLKIYQQILSK